MIVVSFPMTATDALVLVVPTCLASSQTWHVQLNVGTLMHPPYPRNRISRDMQYHLWVYQVMKIKCSIESRMNPWSIGTTGRIQTPP